MQAFFHKITLFTLYGDNKVEQSKWTILNSKNFKMRSKSIIKHNFNGDIKIINLFQIMYTNFRFYTNSTKSTKTKVFQLKPGKSCLFVHNEIIPKLDELSANEKEEEEEEVLNGLTK